MRNATLIFGDGSRFSGKSLGYERPVAGEVVFSTAVTGYPESLTDPSYVGQLMTLTYPLVGDYDVPPFIIEPNGLVTFMESEKIHAEAIIVSDYSHEYSHWNAVENLGDWLKHEQIPGITGTDTCGLARVLREHGVMMGKIVFDDESDNALEAVYAGVNYIDRVSCKEIIYYLPAETSQTFSANSSYVQFNSQFSTFNSQFKKVILVGCGIKANTIRYLLKRNVEVIRVSQDYDYSGPEFDGLFIFNRPGDPDTCDAAVQNIQKAMVNEKSSIFGICTGNQLLSKAGGAKTYKLKYGHCSHNQPVRMVGMERCLITPQNHGYAVDNNTLSVEQGPLLINMNDGSNEEIKHKKNLWFFAQFHPEAVSGPTDMKFLFDESVRLL